MNPTLLNLRHLRAFREVAECRSISLASKRVHLSQPAITQAIAKLEAQLELPLFERRSDGMHATEPGQQFSVRVERALRHLQAGTREAARLGPEKTARRVAHYDHMLTTTQLRALAAVSDARNFSLAARNIGISQPSLHRAARDLERLLGMTLFESTAGGIELTRPARALAQHVKLAYAELAQGFAEAAAWRGQDSGRIVIGSMPLARMSILPAAINTLARKHPEVQVSVLEGPYEDLLHGLRHGEIDLLIGALRDPVPIDDVVQDALFEDELAIVAGAGHPLTDHDGIEVADLARYPWVVPREGTPTRGHFEAMFADAGLPIPAGLVESSSQILIRGLLQDSDRLTIISPHQIRLETRLGLLAVLPVDMAHTSRPIGTTLRRDWHPTATQQDFLGHLREAAEQLQAD